MDDAVTQKQSLLDEAERLAETLDFRRGHEHAQELRIAWKRAGSAERPLSQRFSAAIDRFYDRRRADRVLRSAYRAPQPARRTLPSNRIPDMNELQEAWNEGRR